MKKKDSSLFSTMFIRLRILPLFLIGIWLILSVKYLLLYDYSFTVLSYKDKLLSITKYPKENSKLVTGTFKASDNFLGAVVLQFNPTLIVSNEIIVFRIKEKGASEWFHTDTVNSKHIEHLPQYPFGFPILPNSKGKVYEFEVFVPKKTYISSLLFTSDPPTTIGKYQYPKYILFSQPPKLISFLWNKVVFIAANSNFLVLSFSYLLPFIIYSLLIVLPTAYLPSFAKPIFSVADNLRHVFALLIFTLIYVDVLILSAQYELLKYIILILIITAIRKYSISSDKVFFFAFFFLCSCPYLLITNQEHVAEKAALWAFLFLSVGTAYVLIEKYKKPLFKIKTSLYERK